jgi:hypothetical protein
MKDSRIGESLWFIWDEDPLFLGSPNSVLLYTTEHVDIENEVVRKALASTLQREGIAVSLGDGFKLIDQCVFELGYSGVASHNGGKCLWPCDKDGTTPQGDIIGLLEPTTWVTVTILD